MDHYPLAWRPVLELLENRLMPGQLLGLPFGNREDGVAAASCDALGTAAVSLVQQAGDSADRAETAPATRPAQGLLSHHAEAGRLAQLGPGDLFSDWLADDLAGREAAARRVARSGRSGVTDSTVASAFASAESQGVAAPDSLGSLFAGSSQIPTHLKSLVTPDVTTAGLPASAGSQTGNAAPLHDFSGSSAGCSCCSCCSCCDPGSDCSGNVPPPPTGDVIQTPWDSIPNFGAHPTIVSVHSGPWSNPSTWSGGRLPAAGDIVAIAAGTSVTYDQVSDVHLNTIAVQPGGDLQFRTDLNTRVVVGNFLVQEGGSLEVGTPANPVAANVRAEVVIANQAINLTIDPSQYGTGLVALGTVMMHGAAIQPTFVQTTSVPYAGNTTLELAQAPTGWQVGDQLLIPSSDPHFLYTPGDTTEEATVAAIDGTRVTLTNRLAFNHPGALDGAGDTTFLPYVADLTRNVVIRSENPSGTRGHTLFTLRADVDLEYVQFKDLGRTLAGTIDNTRYDSSGNVTHIGTNQDGRFALHMHHDEGPSQPDGSGYQFQLAGNVIDGSEKWGIDVHNSSFGLIQDNVVYHAQEDGIATQDGSEYQNFFEHNFVASAVGSGFWLNGTLNYFDNNVAADISSSGDTSILVGNGAGYFTPRNLDASVMVTLPLFPGADLTDPTQTTQVPLITTTFLDFSWDEAYGSNMGVWLDHRHGGADQGGHYLASFQAWSMYSSSVSAYDTDGVTIDGLVARNAGVDVLSNVRTVVENSDIQGRTLPGIRYWGNGLDLVIQDSYLRNTSNIEIALMQTAGATVDATTHKTTTIRNVRFKAPIGNPLRAITLQYQTYSNYSRVPVVPNQIYVDDYNQHPGENFQVFFKEQAPTFIVPYEGDIPYDPNLARKASPVPGLTNAQCWAQFGLAVGGAVSPSADDTTYPEIYGYTYPLSS